MSSGEGIDGCRHYVHKPAESPPISRNADDGPSVSWLSPSANLVNVHRLAGETESRGRSPSLLIMPIAATSWAMIAPGRRAGCHHSRCRTDGQPVIFPQTSNFSGLRRHPAAATGRQLRLGHGDGHFPWRRRHWDWHHEGAGRSRNRRERSRPPFFTIIQHPSSRESASRSS